MTSAHAFDQPLEPEPGFILDPPAMGDASLVAEEEAEQPEDDIVGTMPPEHGWPGIAFVWTMACLGVATLGFAAWLFVAPAEGIGWRMRIALLPMSLLPGALMVWVAWMTHNFKLWGVGVTGLLFLYWIRNLLRMLGSTTNVYSIAFGLFSLCCIAVWISYLWSRRDDFS